jgi:hypothetical protein
MKHQKSIVIFADERSELDATVTMMIREWILSGLAEHGSVTKLSMASRVPTSRIYSMMRLLGIETPRTIFQK